jgi:hypothetical protein
MSIEHGLNQATGAGVGPTDPDLIEREPANLTADGSEETLSDLDLEEDVRDYDLGEGD